MNDETALQLVQTMRSILVELQNIRAILARVPVRS